VAEDDAVTSKLLTISRSLVAETLGHLREAGDRPAEGIVLWLGRPAAGAIWIAPEGMAALLGKLGDERLFVAAQVHSHPGAAFHSEADDRWAIVRHVGALSLVVPHFARATTVGTFLSDAAIFRLSAGNRWTAVDRPDHGSAVSIL
jgi:hypothetical protein